MKLFEKWTQLGQETFGDTFEQCQFILDNKRYTGMIKEFGENHINVKPMSIDYESCIFMEKVNMIKLTKDMFDKIKLELWDDARGCDNSAIGVAGCYEPWENFIWE